MKNEETNGVTNIAMSEKTRRRIYEFIGKHPAERGGILGADPDGVIRHFTPDHTARCSAGAYDPDIEEMNRQIKVWKSENIHFVGFVHSHPPGFKRLSGADEDYATKILAAFKSLDRLCLPLVMTVPDSGHFELLGFVALPEGKNRKTVSILPAELEVEGELSVSTSASATTAVQTTAAPGSSPAEAKSSAPDAKHENDASNQATSDSDAVDAPLTSWHYYGDFPSAWRETNLRKRGQSPLERIEPLDRLKELQQDDASRHLAKRHFERVVTAVNALLLDVTRLVIIGAGGAASLIRDCARCAFGEFVLVDPDQVSESNVGSQSADPAKIGTAKAEALAHDIRNINPASAVLAVSCKIEAITDADFEVLARAPLRYCNDATVTRILGSNPLGHPKQPGQVILLGLTDNFHAQARVHRLGLQYGIPTICAQEYSEGRGAEITWTVPGVTAACHRCLTSSRYQDYAAGYVNTVTSSGAPIFAAQMLNAALGHITLAVAHHGSRHPRYGNWIARMGNRNLLLIRMDPDFDQFMGRPVFGRRLAGAAEPGAFLMLDSLFVAQTPDAGQSENRPVCPDCGGVGDLRQVIGTFADTRLMRDAGNQPNNKQ